MEHGRVMSCNLQSFLLLVSWQSAALDNMAKGEYFQSVSLLKYFLFLDMITKLLNVMIIKVLSFPFQLNSLCPCEITCGALHLLFDV